MPISPTPPSGAKTSSCCGLRHRSALTAPVRNTSPAATVAHARPACATTRRPASSRPRSGRASSRSGRRTRMSSPRPAARASQSARIVGKARAALPLRQPAQHRRRQRREQRLGVDHARRRRPDRSPDSRCRPDGATQLTPMPTTTANAGSLSPSIRMPASLSPPPAADRSAISASAAARAAARSRSDGVVQRQRRHERQLRRQRLAAPARSAAALA